MVNPVISQRVVQLLGRGLRGESFGDTVRRLGDVSGLPVSPGATDQEIINALTASIALTGANTYPDTAAGIAETVSGDSFWVADADGLRLYRNDDGVAEEIDPFTSADKIGVDGGGTSQDMIMSVSAKAKGAALDLVTDDTDTIQAAIDAAGPFGLVDISGPARITGTLYVPRGQRIRGRAPNWFINTNDGMTWSGPNTGEVSQGALFYDAESGAAIELAEGAVLEDLMIYGKGYTTPGVNIQQPEPSTIYDVTGVRKLQFATLRNCAIFYFRRGVHSTGGDYYSRHDNVEITRCTVAEKFDLAAYNQVRMGCTIRVCDKPFEFGGTLRGFKWIGGSIEGWREPTEIPVRSAFEVSSSYFETFNDDLVIPSCFKLMGGDCLIQIQNNDIYLNHNEAFLDVNGQVRTTLISSGNQFINSVGSSVAVSTAYRLPANAAGGDYRLSGDKAPQITNESIRGTGTGSIAANSTSLAFSGVTLSPGQRVDIAGAGAGGAVFSTVVLEVSGSTATLRDPAITAVSSATVSAFASICYVPIGLGTGLLGFNIEPALNTNMRFGAHSFSGGNAKTRQARASQPSPSFNGGNAGVAEYCANYADWNPAGRTDGRGAYPVALRGGRYYPMIGSVTGRFTMTAAATMVVPNIYTAAQSDISINPVNAAAAALMASSKYLYTISIDPGTSFTVSTADSTAATGAEIFSYSING